MANPFQAAARGQAIRRLIATILSGKERDIAREDELSEIERRLKAERWQQGMAERRFAGEEAGREATAEHRAATLAEAVRSRLAGETEATRGREQAATLAREGEAAAWRREVAGQAGAGLRSLISSVVPQIGGGIREYLGRAAERADRPTWGSLAELGGKYGLGVTPEEEIDPGALQVLATLIQQAGATTRAGMDRGGADGFGMETEEKNVRVEIRNLYADRDGGDKEVFDEAGLLRVIRVRGVPPGTPRYDDLTRQIQALEARLPEAGAPPAPPAQRRQPPSWMGGTSRLRWGAPGVAGRAGPSVSIDELAAQYGG